MACKQLRLKDQKVLPLNRPVKVSPTLIFFKTSPEPLQPNDP